MVLVTIGFWVLASIALLIYTAGARLPTVHELVVAPGTSTGVAAGDNPLELPSTWSYYAGDRLIIHNQDDVEHWVGPWLLPPNSTFEVELHPVLAGSFVCSLHPSGTITLDVQPRGFAWQQTLFPGLVLGPILGLIVVGTRRVIEALEDE